ncbi:MAG: ankyrin repeat domain-containing protein [Gammaproteobacteria bacterium]
MKNLFCRTWAAVAFAISVLFVAPALAACDLCTLAKNNDWAAAEALLDNSPPVNPDSGAVAVDVNGQDKNGRTALFIAVKRGYAEFAMNLIAHGAYSVDVTIPNGNGRTPLMWAAQNGDFELVLDLLKNGANIHAQRNGNDRTALDFALNNGNSDVAEYLVAEGAELSCDSGEQFNAETIACEPIEPIEPECGENQEPVDGVCECVDGFQQVGNICIPTIAYCHEMDKILNDEYECESCEFYEERVENECLIRCDDDTQMRDPDDKNSCICVDDFVDDGHGNCIPIPDCGVNSEWDGNSCVCIGGYMSDNDGVCIPECDMQTQQFSEELNSCVPAIAYCNEIDKIRNADLQCEYCPSGQHRHENSCHADHPTSADCHAQGKVLHNEQCISCPGGQHRHENVCHSAHTCPGGQHKHGHDSCHANHPTTAQCNAQGKIKQGNFCVSCPSGQQRQGNFCVPTSYQCEEHGKFGYQFCSCPSGHHRHGGTCHASHALGPRPSPCPRAHISNGHWRCESGGNDR